MTESKNVKVSARKIVTASIVGLAGGVTVASVIPGMVAIILGSILGAGVTGIAEYKREIKANSTEATQNL